MTVPSGRQWPTILGLAVLTAVCAVVAGPIGAIAGVTTAVIWYGLGLPYAIAAGHVVLAAGTDIGIAAIVAVELGFLAVVLASLVGHPSSRPAAGVALVSAVGLIGAALLVSTFYALWLAAAIVLGGIALGAYGLHRYELVRLGLVADDNPAEYPSHDD